MDAISSVLVEDEDLFYFELVCQSFHLTSFAVLMDVHGITAVRIWLAAYSSFWIFTFADPVPYVF